MIQNKETPEKIKERRNKKDVESILKRLYQKACEYLDHKRNTTAR